MVFTIAHPVEKANFRTDYLIDIQGLFAYTALQKDNKEDPATGNNETG
jgi:hypothetical protein